MSLIRQPKEIKFIQIFVVKIEESTYSIWKVRNQDIFIINE
jgi:hypothetical protein